MNIYFHEFSIIYIVSGRVLTCLRNLTLTHIIGEFSKNKLGANICGVTVLFLLNRDGVKFVRKATALQVYANKYFNKFL